MTDSNRPDMESQGQLDLGIRRDMLVPALQSPAPHTGRQMNTVNPRMIATVPETSGICNRRRADPRTMWCGAANSHDR